MPMESISKTRRQALSISREKIHEIRQGAFPPSFSRWNGKVLFFCEKRLEVFPENVTLGGDGLLFIVRGGTT